MKQDSTQRLAKAISNAGLCSRRDAELLIKNSEVKVPHRRTNHSRSRLLQEVA